MVSYVVKREGKTANSPVGNAQPRDAVKPDDRRCAPGGTREADDGDHAQDTDIRHHDDTPLFFGEEDGVCYDTCSKRQV